MGSRAEEQLPTETPKPPSAQYLGRFTSGKWFCDCNHLASCRTVKRAGPDKGKSFWVCPKDRESADRCCFFLFTENEPEVKEWLEKHRPPQAPETPGPKDDIFNDPATPSTGKPLKSLETPFTRMANRKRKPDMSATDTEENEIAARSMNGSGNIVADGPSDENSPGKRAKRARFITPPPSTKRDPPNYAAVASSSSKDDETFNSEVEIRRSMASSPTPTSRRSQAPTAQNANTPDLTSTILNMLRSDSVMIKGTTETRIRHEIGLREDSFVAKERRYDKTIADLLGRINELESTLELLTEGCAVGDPIELSG